MSLHSFFLPHAFTPLHPFFLIAEVDKHASKCNNQQQLARTDRPQYEGLKNFEWCWLYDSSQSKGEILVAEMSVHEEKNTGSCRDEWKQMLSRLTQENMAEREIRNMMYPSHKEAEVWQERENITSAHDNWKKLISFLSSACSSRVDEFKDKKYIQKPQIDSWIESCGKEWELLGKIIRDILEREGKYSFERTKKGEKKKNS